jgi:hypothetical protein
MELVRRASASGCACLSDFFIGVRALFAGVELDLNRAFYILAELSPFIFSKAIERHND